MFWGLALQPNSSQGLGDKVDGGILHLSQACLSATKPGKNYLEVEVEGSKYRICCLEQDKVEHISCDLFFGDKDTTFYNKGASAIHLTGYIEPENDEMDDEEEEEEEEAPPAKAKAKAEPKAKAGAKATPAPSPKVAPKASPKVEPKTSPKVSPKAEPKASPKSAPKKGPQDEDESSDDDEEGEEEELLEGEEEDEEEEEEDDAPAPKAAAKAAVGKSGAKRKDAPAPEPAKKAEPPAKKKKGEAGSPAPAKAGDPVADYLGKLKAYLKENGKTNLGQLGSKVPKPDGVPKIGKLLGEHKDKFKVENQMVSVI